MPTSAEPIFLCKNPACAQHAEIVFDAKLAERLPSSQGWRFKDGFRMGLTKGQLNHFDPHLQLCYSCFSITRPKNVWDTTITVDSNMPSISVKVVHHF